jgi:hypothetical protein
VPPNSKTRLAWHRFELRSAQWPGMGKYEKTIEKANLGIFTFLLKQFKTY